MRETRPLPQLDRAWGGVVKRHDSRASNRFRCVSQAAKPSRLINPTFLFRFQFAIQPHGCQWTPAGLDLPPVCRIPCFSELAGQRRYGDVRLAWDAAAIGFSLDVSGKKAGPWCRDSRLEDSDGFQLCIDTRCSPGIHRATGYCHRFLFMPTGAGTSGNLPLTRLLPIHRARQNPKPAPAGSIQVYAQLRPDGYRLSGRIAAAALTGFDTSQFPRLAIYYALMDRELGWQTLTLGTDFPSLENPSMWAEAVLSGGERSRGGSS